MTPIPAPTPTPQREQSIRVPVLWGLAFGAIQAASPLALWWLDQATVQALLLALIAAVYIGFAVADGRVRIIVVECGVAMAFVAVAAVVLTACGSSSPTPGSTQQQPPTANMKPMARHRAAKFISIVPPAYPK